MNMPGYNAEASLGPTLGIYRGNAVFGRLGTGDVLPMQEFLASSPFSQNLNFGHSGSILWVTRCCRYAPILGKWICASRAHSPLEQCRCLSGAFGPVIVCSPPVLQQ